MKRLFVLLLVSMLCACATSTIDNKKLANPETMNSLVVNKTTMTEVKALLGDPTSDYPDGSGDVLWGYMLTSASSRVFSSTEVDQTIVSLRFRKGLLVEKAIKKPQY